MTSVMEFFKRLFNYPRKKPGTNIEQRVSWLLRPYVSTMQDIIMWKDVKISAVTMIVINLLLWVIRLLEVRPLGLISGILLILVTLDGLATALGAGKRPCRERTSGRNNNGEQLMRATVRARQWLSVACADMLQLRQDNPSKFCIVMCGGLGVLWFVAYVGGTLLIHLIANLVFLSPLLPSIQKTIKSIQSHADSDGEVEEFMPEMSTHAMEELHRAGEMQDSEELAASPRSLDLNTPDDLNVLHAAAEAESSEDETDNFLEAKKVDRSHSSTPSLPSTNSSDSESDFIPKVDTPHKNLTFEDTREKIVPISKNVNEAMLNQAIEGWVPFLMSAAGSYLKYPWSPSSPVKQQQSHDSDSDEFELIERSEL